MDVMKTETTFEPCGGKSGSGKEQLIPIDKYTQKMGLKRDIMDRYVKAGRIETRERQGKTYVVDRPLAEKDWFEIDIVQAQAKIIRRWQIASLALAGLSVLAVLAGIVGGLILWTDKATSIQILSAAETQFAETDRELTALQGRIAAADKQIASLQQQLAAERRDYTTKLESEQAQLTTKIDGLTTAETQLAKTSKQLEALQARFAATNKEHEAQLTALRQDYEAQLKSQQVSHAATVDQLHTGIDKLSTHIVELTKALAELEQTP